MNDKAKRKNDDFPLSTYDQTWLFRLYRWLRWDCTDKMIVNASPEACLACFQTDAEHHTSDVMVIGAITRPHSPHQVKRHNAPSPFWFAVDLNPSYPAAAKVSYRNYVFAIITRYEDDDQRSLITFRTYPHGFSTLITLMAALLIMLLVLVNQAHNGTLTLMNDGLVMILALLILWSVVAVWRNLFVTAQARLANAMQHFVMLWSVYEAQEENDAYLLREEELYERETQK